MKLRRFNTYGGQTLVLLLGRVRFGVKVKRRGWDAGIQVWVHW